MPEDTKETKDATEKEVKAEVPEGEANQDPKELSAEEAAKAARRKEIEQKVAAAQAARQKQDDEETAEEMKKRLIDEKGTAYYGAHATISCDGCGTGPIFGWRFHCKSCANHDICETCFDAWRGGKGVMPNGLAKQTISTSAGDHKFTIYKDSSFRSMVSGASGAVKMGPKPKPNDQCACGSGKKYKKCCMNTGE
eukprot:TRINITY_DN70361_c0_g1_i1.p1 TRINITY_DN70361_c0_g1~~TRINITY_DN70361_c0_g1_i1.p1  ORF type:complete len:195 (-),score=48.20 TRINITY_DN70361_c0_g1_i1:170-754(-)